MWSKIVVSLRNDLALVMHDDAVVVGQMSGFVINETVIRLLCCVVVKIALAHRRWLVEADYSGYSLLMLTSTSVATFGWSPYSHGRRSVGDASPHFSAWGDSIGIDPPLFSSETLRGI